jgi:hypothetical protein
VEVRHHAARTGDLFAVNRAGGKINISRDAVQSTRGWPMP